ncbi:MAG: helix-turn-helix transcriptional regulator [Bacteroidota bacterium]
MNYKEIIKRCGIKQKHVARLIGVSEPTLTLFLNGEKGMSEDKIDKLDKFVKVLNDVLEMSKVS